MECRIIPDAPLLEPDRLAHALFEADPAAVFDIDSSGGVRIATSLDVHELLALLHATGCEVARDNVKILPSICCGGCSG